MPDSQRRTLGDVLNELQLPIDAALESAALSVVTGLTSARNWSESDAAVLMDEALDDWAATGAPNPTLVRVTTAVLALGQQSNASIDGPTYFQVYQRLRDGTTDWIGLSHTVARRLLSRTTLIAHLLATEKLSCSQVARLLQATEASLDVPHPAVSVIARALHLNPELNASAAGTELWNADQARSLSLFPDSSVDESCEVAGLEAAKWVPEADTTRLLRELSRSRTGIAGNVFWPYLQILNWCCVPIEFYDHPASYLYEFSPRGHIALALFARYPAVTGNPVLNNAKAVQTLNSTWARNRGGDDAQALVALLNLLESLPFAARRQVARLFRAWLCRVIELETVQPVLIQGPLAQPGFDSVVDFVTANETNTQGVIEQRVVDCLSTLAFSSHGWRAKGIGDGINASNLSRHKLGDVEFANLDERTAVALEAHGGHLSGTYVKDHQRSLARIVHQRLAESWEDLDEPSNWSVKVLFVAHSRDATGLPSSEVLHGVSITYEYWTYGELRNAAITASDEITKISVFNALVVDALNKPTVRQSARDKFLSIAA
jgi:hypothetical protein